MAAKFQTVTGFITLKQRTRWPAGFHKRTEITLKIIESRKSNPILVSEPFSKEEKLAFENEEQQLIKISATFAFVPK